LLDMRGPSPLVASRAVAIRAWERSHVTTLRKSAFGPTMNLVLWPQIAHRGGAPLAGQCALRRMLCAERDG
jgi:hypothetical protein